MAQPVRFPRHVILAGAMLFGVLLTLGLHVIIQRFDLNIADLWRPDTADLIPARAALAWWLISATAFVTGYIAATLMDGAIAGQLSPRMRQFLIAVGVILAAAAGQAASAPSPVPTLPGVAAGLAALVLGAALAFCGAHFALRRA
jgi:hypothetical protein